ncbi:hypothetical protein ACHAQA_006289 [Verticillium albo-atrum]
MTPQTTNAVLITGVSGHIGFRVLTDALIAGYQVHAVVRKETHKTKIETADPVQPYLPQLKIFVIPDLATPGAFDVVPQDVWAIIHVASPTFSGFGDVNVADFASTAWKLTRNILDYAVKTPSVKRVVITSSISAITPFFKDIQDPAMFYTRKAHSAPMMRGGKLMESQAILQYWSTVSRLYQKWPLNRQLLSHIGDVSKAHVGALNSHWSTGVVSNILPVFNSKADATPIEWEDCVQFVKEDFPEATASGMFPFGGAVPSQKVLVDSTTDEELLGSKFKGYREAVSDLIQQHLRLASNDL